ncbi:AraC family transcriptional regulator [Sphingobacterium sp. GVS05A]|uniref:AraC family transcriptional regulator n=1 Tax=Sphingobacterium TaxID=28453 RepID=UPI001CC11125|nr:helix-turn-helix transcriptional regulator [Sphingobacterium sp. GVS05A]
MLFDIGRIETLENYVLDNTLHQLSFYEIIFIEEGSGTLSIGDKRIPLSSESIVFTSPGQTRRWAIEKNLTGYVLFFEKDFLDLFFFDNLFLYRFQFFHQYVQPPTIKLDEYFFNQCVNLVQAIIQEFSYLQHDSDHLIRALLYQLLITINRLYSKTYNLQNNEVIHSDFQRFKVLLEKEYAVNHNISKYAKMLNISPKILNKLCNQYSGLSAQQMIHQKLISEIKKELILKKSAKEITYAFGFSDPSNFNRFFKRNTGITPQQFQKEV